MNEMIYYIPVEKYKNMLEYWLNFITTQEYLSFYFVNSSNKFVLTIEIVKQNIDCRIGNGFVKIFTNNHEKDCVLKNCSDNNIAIL